MMKRILINIILLIPLFVSADTDLFEQANNAYKNEKFEKAVHLYDSLLQKEQSFEVFYNLGNSYFKLNQASKAMLMYHRALKIHPNDEELNNNISYAQERLNIEKPSSGKEIKDLVDNVSAWVVYPLWQYIAIVLLLSTCIIVFFLFRVSAKSTSRAVLFYFAILSAILMGLSYFLAYRQYNTLFISNEGIVMPNSISVYGEPSPNSNEVFEISGGYKVKVLDRVDDWYEIAINNGNVGWTSDKNIEMIELNNEKKD